MGYVCHCLSRLFLNHVFTSLVNYRRRDIILPTLMRVQFCVEVK